MAAPQPQDPPSDLADYLGRPVVIDTRSTYIIVGTLTRVGRDYLTLGDVDVHDTRRGVSTKDQYVMEANRLGVCTNRREARVRLAVVVSISLLADVVTF